MNKSKIYQKFNYLYYYYFKLNQTNIYFSLLYNFFFNKYLKKISKYITSNLKNQ